MLTLDIIKIIRLNVVICILIFSEQLFWYVYLACNTNNQRPTSDSIAPTILLEFDKCIPTRRQFISVQDCTMEALAFTIKLYYVGVCGCLQ